MTYFQTETMHLVALCERLQMIVVCDESKTEIKVLDTLLNKDKTVSVCGSFAAQVH